MFKKEAFAGTPAQDTLAELQGQYKFEAGATIEQVTDRISDLLLHAKIYSDAPRYVLSRTFYSNDNNEVTSARFVLRPSSSHVLDSNPVRKEWTILAGPDFYDKLIADIAEWMDIWTYNAKLQENLDEINALFAELTQRAEVDYTVSFGIGYGILDVDGSHTVIGLSEGVIQSLADFVLFSEEELRSSYSREAVVNILKEFQNGYELIRSKSYIFKRDLQIWNRKSYSRLIREFVTRQAKHTRVGVGYISTPELFALIERKAITEKEAEVYLNDSSVIVEDNVDPNASERKKEQTKILTTVRLAPISKELGSVLEVSIAELVALSKIDFDEEEIEEAEVEGEDGAEEDSEV